MAWLQQDPSGNFHVCFRFGGAKFKRSPRTKKRQEAETRQTRLEENIRLVAAGRIEIPSDADLPTFLLLDGKLVNRPRAVRRLSLAGLFDEFFTALPQGHLEQSTVRGMMIHRRHFEYHLGSGLPLARDASSLDESA